MIDERTDGRYIGDGVYASFDGYHVWLRTGEEQQIALEPQVLWALDAYREALAKKYEAPGYAPTKAQEEQP